jgi:hypothetical protein
MDNKCSDLQTPDILFALLNGSQLQWITNIGPNDIRASEQSQEDTSVVCTNMCADSN